MKESESLNPAWWQRLSPQGVSRWQSRGQASVKAAALCMVVCLIIGAMVPVYPFLVMVAVFGLLLGLWASRNIAILFKNVGWSILTLALLVLVAAGNLDLEAFGLHAGFLAKKEVLCFVALFGTTALRIGLDFKPRGKFRLHWILGLVAFYTLAVIISMAFVGNKPPLWGAMWAIIPMLAFVAGLWWYRTTADLLFFLTTGALLCSLAAASGILQRLAPQTFNDTIYPFLLPGFGASLLFSVERLGRVTSIWAQPTPYAMFLSILLPVFGLMLRRFGKVRQVIALLGLFLTLTALLMTGSRIALIAGIIGLVVTQWTYLSWSKRLLLLGMIVIGLISGLVVRSLTDVSSQGLLETLVIFATRGDQWLASWIGRLEIYRLLMRVWLERPLCGVGPGNLAESIRELTISNTTGHSFWLQLLAELGLVGLVTYLLLLLSLATLYSHKSRGLRAEPALLFRCVIGISLAVLIQSFMDNSLLLWQFSAIFWLLQGAVVAMLQYENQNLIFC